MGCTNSVDHSEEPVDNGLINGNNNHNSKKRYSSRTSKGGRLFEDQDFPADLSALFNEASLKNGICAAPQYANLHKIKWLRPKEILGRRDLEPQLVLDGATRDDIKQGNLGDCWFLSSCAAVSQKGKLLDHVIPLDQELSGPKYNGAVTFKFWKYGQWVEVIIDDRLPTINNELIYGQNTDPREFWVSLLEKAYAKFNGSYENLEGGSTMSALVDLTGGLAQRYDLPTKQLDLYKLIFKAHRNGAFIACSRKGDWKNSITAEANGLLPGHAYTVTNVEEIEHQKGKEKLIRVRNPWADATEWRGSWSDDDSNWEWVDEKTKQRIQQESKDDGEFWISCKDFYNQFIEVTICLMNPDFDGDGVSDIVGHSETIKGEWVIGQSAGGSRKNLENFATNDQYLLTLSEPDDFNDSTDDPENEGKSTIMIALMQDSSPPKRNTRAVIYQIGFFIYKAEDGFKLSAEHFQFNRHVAKSDCFVNYREVSGRFTLEPGQYIVIPSTYLEDCPAKFMLRIFGEKKFLLSGPLLPRLEEDESFS